MMDYANDVVYVRPGKNRIVINGCVIERGAKSPSPYGGTKPSRVDWHQCVLHTVMMKVVWTNADIPMRTPIAHDR
jgi:hypothetical protein